MRGPIDPPPARDRQRRHIPFVGLDLARPRPIHRRVIRIGHDHLVAERLELLRDPLALGTALQQNPQARPTAEDPIELRPRRVDPTIQDHRLLLIENPNLTTSQMQINGTIFHGWLLLAP